MAVLFGIEATRQLIFGTFNLFLWLIVAIFIIWAIFELYDQLRDKRTPEQKAEDKAKEKARAKAVRKEYKKVFIFWAKIIVIATLSLIALVFIIPQK